MVRIRLTKTGKRNAPCWRIGAFEKRTRRDGKAIEYLGTYDPHAETPQEKVNVDMERLQYWLDRGAQPSKTVQQLLSRVEA